MPADTIRNCRNDGLLLFREFSSNVFLFLIFFRDFHVIGFNTPLKSPIVFMESYQRENFAHLTST